MKSIFAPARGLAGIKLGLILALSLASLALYHVDGRYILAERDILPNLDFSEGGKYWAASSNTIAIRKSDPAILLMANKPEERTVVWQSLDNPTRYRTIRIGADLRVAEVAKGEQWWHQAGLVFLSVDENGAKMPYWPSTIALLSGSTEWQRFEAFVPVAAESRSAQLSVFLIKSPGALAVRNITVDAFDEAPWFVYSRAGLIALWIAVVLWIVIPLAVRHRRNPAAQISLILFLITLGGVLTPQPQQSQFLGFLRMALDDIAAPATPELFEPATTAPDGEAGESPEREAKPSPRDDDASAPKRKREFRSDGLSTQVIAALPAVVKRGGGSFAAHFTAHALLAFFLLLAFAESGWFRIILYLVVLAAATEIVQVFLITRTTNLIDGSFNMAGTAAGIAAWFFWYVARRRIFGNQPAPT